LKNSTKSEEWKDASVLPLVKRISVCSQYDAHNLRLLFSTPTKTATTNSAFNSFGHSIKNGPFRESLTEGIFVSKDKNDNLGRIENALILHEKSQSAFDKIRAAIKAQILPRKHAQDLIEMAFEKSVITSEEKNLMQEAESAILDAMQVDEYSLEEYKKI
jgi:hypothetical protein